MVTVFYGFCCVLCVVVCARGDWFLGVHHWLIHSKYDILYYGIVLGVGIIIVVLDTYTILVKYLAWENDEREKKLQISCVCCVL
jgi:hypothetical protein